MLEVDSVKDFVNDLVVPVDGVVPSTPSGPPIEDVLPSKSSFSACTPRDSTGSDSQTPETHGKTLFQETRKETE